MIGMGKNVNKNSPYDENIIHHRENNYNINLHRSRIAISKQGGWAPAPWRLMTRGAWALEKKNIPYTVVCVRHRDN
ncbi:MAG: hypothetical protein GY859_29290 [Desulfobacterales bacterium]|nr:hypothetical protein [Desulfobacterales bacterium]